MLLFRRSKFFGILDFFKLKFNLFLGLLGLLLRLNQFCFFGLLYDDWGCYCDLHSLFFGLLGVFCLVSFLLRWGRLGLLLLACFLLLLLSLLFLGFCLLARLLLSFKIFLGFLNFDDIAVQRVDNLFVFLFGDFQLLCWFLLLLRLFLLLLATRVLLRFWLGLKLRLHRGLILLLLVLLAQPLRRSMLLCHIFGCSGI